MLKNLFCFLSLIALISAKAQDTTGCALVSNFTYEIGDDALNLESTASGTTSLTVFTWYVDFDIVGTGETISVDLDELPDNPLICLSVYDSLDMACFDSTCTNINVDDTSDPTASIFSEKANFKLNIYPNPTTNHLNVVLPETNSANNIIIYDAIGKAVLFEKRTSETNLIQVDVTHLPEGIYILQLINEKNEFENVRQQFIKR